MERVGALINRLQEQYQQNASPDKMLVTLQILAAELELEKSKQVRKGSGVSVTAPTFLRSRDIDDEPIRIPSIRPVAVAAEIRPAVVEVPKIDISVAPKPAVISVVEIEPKIAEIPKVELPKVELPKVETPKIEAPKVETPVVPKIPQAFSYDVVKDIPTLAQRHREVLELNERMAAKEESLNDRLKTNGADFGASMQYAPVKDLKKAIGINDRYVFLNELFRGDEVMYERSLKTINAFGNFAEAEFWIKRELKLKLGWNENSHAAQQFDQLVNRRFS